jgi:uncharacterized protein DUF3565
MERSIVGFHLDAQGEWVAELACGHRQHVRHKPPFYPRPWVLEAEGRQQHLGTPLECRLCNQNVPARRLAARRPASHTSSVQSAASSSTATLTAPAVRPLRDRPLNVR